MLYLWMVFNIYWKLNRAMSADLSFSFCVCLFFTPFFFAVKGSFGKCFFLSSMSRLLSPAPKTSCCTSGWNHICWTNQKYNYLAKLLQKDKLLNLNADLQRNVQMNSYDKENPASQSVYVTVKVRYKSELVYINFKKNVSTLSSLILFCFVLPFIYMWFLYQCCPKWSSQLNTVIWKQLFVFFFIVLFCCCVRINNTLIPLSLTFV